MFIDKTFKLKTQNLIRRLITKGNCWFFQENSNQQCGLGIADETITTDTNWTPIWMFEDFLQICRYSHVSNAISLGIEAYYWKTACDFERKTIAW